ncbi:MAG: hypothetical protein P8M32_08850 [Phycisphaerales bacterium]|nr:hypothetical protein [Phycisphaerales bacterium]
MGQVALGLRSLGVRIVVFFIMAALLAWALGGTLWPWPVSAIQRPVINAGGTQWGWLVTVDPASLEVFYDLAKRDDDGWEPIEGVGPFPAVLPLVAGTGNEPEGVLFHVSVRGPSDQPRVLAIGINGIVESAESVPAAK